VRHLARNVSGLELAPNLPASVVYGNKNLYLAYGGDVVRAAMNYSAVHSPGTRSELAQENTQLLAHVIERATVMPVQTLLSERVWKPFGATLRFDRPSGHARAMCCMRAIGPAYGCCGRRTRSGRAGRCCPQAG